MDKKALPFPMDHNSYHHPISTSVLQTQWMGGIKPQDLASSSKLTNSLISSLGDGIEIKQLLSVEGGRVSKVAPVWILPTM